MGIGFSGALGIVFVVLKLTGVIAWSWLWVLAPFWVGLALALLAVVAVLLVTAVKATSSALRDRSTE